MGKSRVRRRQETTAKRNIIFMGLGALIIIMMGALYGPQLLIKLSIGVEKLHNPSNSQSSNTNTNDQAYVAPPHLDPLPSATNSAETNITGYALSGQTVKLYVNDSVVDQTIAKNDGTFSFHNISLDKGTNTIKAKALAEDNNTSAFSDLVTISYLSQNPTLTINQPQDGQHFPHDTTTLPITGKTDPQDNITVNGFWAIVDDQGNYSYRLPLNDGDTTITVVTTDQAGNTSTKTLTVHRDS